MELGWKWAREGGTRGDRDGGIAREFGCQGEMAEGKKRRGKKSWGEMELWVHSIGWGRTGSAFCAYLSLFLFLICLLSYSQIHDHSLLVMMIICVSVVMMMIIECACVHW